MKPSAIMLLLLSVHSAAFLASARLAATTRLAMTALPATGPANRAAVGINMYLPEDEPQALLSRVQWVKTESGLSFKEIEAGSGAVPGPRETVTIAYKASFLSSGEIIEQTAASRPLTITLGADFLPMFQEAVEGMAVGGRRRVLMPPSSQYSRLEEETIQFELELVAVKTAREAALFKLQQAIGNNRNLFRLALFLTFLPDILNFVGVTPPGAGAIVSDAAFLRAPELASAAAQHAPVALDAANRWAEGALSLLN